MEHLFTSFFRSSAAGSFKEHRMVFQTAVPERIQNAEDIQNAEKAHEELSNSGDIRRATDLRLLLVRTSIENAALRPQIDAAVQRIDRNTTARNLVPVETTRLEVSRRDVATKLNTPADRAAGVNEAIAKIAEARTKLSELGDNGRPDSLTSSRLTLSALYRDQIAALTDMAKPGAMLNKLKVNATTTIDINPPLSDAEKLRIGTPYGAETAADNASKLRLGNGYIQTLRSVPGATVNQTAPNTYEVVHGTGAEELKVALSWDAALNTWMERVITGPGARGGLVRVDAGGAPGAYEVFAAADIAALPATPNRAARVAFAERVNAVATGLNNGVMQAVAADLATVIRDANAAEGPLAATDLTNLDTAQATFFATDFNAAVGRLNAAITPEAKTRALDNATAPDLGLRVVSNTRREALWTRVKALSDNPNRPSNYEQQITKLMDQIREVGTRLRAEEVRVGVATPERPTTPDATRIDTPATAPLRAPRMDGRAIVIDGIVPPNAQILVTRPGATTPERLAAVGGVLRIADAPAGVHRFVSGPHTTEINVPAAGPDATPVTPEVTTFLGTEGERTALKNALQANLANLDAPAVRDALRVFQNRLAAVPETQRNGAVTRLAEATRVAPTATTDGAEVQIDGANLKVVRMPRTAATGPTAPERKERNERLGEFIKVLIELVRALLQIEQARSASIDRFLTRSLEQQQKFMNDMRGQMQAIEKRGGTGSPEYRALQTRYKTAQEQIKTLEARVKELESRHEAAVKAAGRTGTLEVRWTPEDRRASRPPVVCVRRSVRLSEPRVAAEVSADIAMVRREVPLVASAPTVSAAAPTAVVPTTTFYVGTMNIDNRATTTVNNVNSPGSTINAAAAASTNVGGTNVATPPPRRPVRREGNITG